MGPWRISTVTGWSHPLNRAPKQFDYSNGTFSSFKKWSTIGHNQHRHRRTNQNRCDEGDTSLTAGISQLTANRQGTPGLLARRMLLGTRQPRMQIQNWTVNSSPSL